MIRPCFFPSSFKRRSKISVNNLDQKQQPLFGRNFVKRLDLSQRKPTFQEKHKSSYSENQNLWTGEDETIDLSKNNIIGSKQKKFRSTLCQNEIRPKRIFLLPQKRQIKYSKQLRKRSDFQILSTKSNRIGISEIKNTQDFSFRSKNQRINMTERVKIRPKKQLENIIVGWEYFQESDTNF